MQLIEKRMNKTKIPSIKLTFETAWVSGDKFYRRNFGFIHSFFNELHGMLTRSSDENSVCPSLRLSNAWIVTKRKKNQCRFLYHTKVHFNLVLREKEWLMGETPSTWNFGSTGPRWSEIAAFEQIIARSTSAVTPREKVQSTPRVASNSPVLIPLDLSHLGAMMESYYKMQPRPKNDNTPY